jgi:teichoic acid transport system ATP-binding protein
MNDNDISIKFENVTKKYKLFKNERKRLLSLFIDSPKLYKEKTANDNISFEIKRGESVAIMGRNGAGKSTLLKMISGVAFPTEGEVTVNGRVSALLALTAGFNREFTGMENIYLRGHLMGLDDKKIDEILPKILDFAEIDEYIDQPTRTYSSGMRARLGFAINANINPEILVIDEALSVGDSEFRKKCKLKIREISERDHVTVLMVSHGSSAKAFCTRGIVLKDGKLIFDGPIDEATKAYKESVKKKEA